MIIQQNITLKLGGARIVNQNNLGEPKKAVNKLSNTYNNKKGKLSSYTSYILESSFGTSNFFFLHL